MVLGVGAWAVAYSAQKRLSGPLPTKQYADIAGTFSDSELQDLRKAAADAPEDIGAWKNLSQSLVQKVSAGPADTKIIFELVDALRHILSLSPDDRYALKMMADISYDFRVYNKAVEFYTRYLELEPSDEEVKARFEMVKKEISQGTGDSSQSTPLPPYAEKFYQIVKSNKVAGPKLKGARMGDPSVLILEFADFPMEEMPPFAKQKFFGNLNSAAKDAGKLRTVIFLDKASGREMERLELTSMR